MPLLDDHPSNLTTKLLFVGDSGAGKTGALASLAKAGFNLRIIDMDNGLDILRDLLKDDAAARKRVIFETCTDRFKYSGPNPVPRTALAWSKMVGLLNNWPDLGPITSWSPQDILVLDSATFAGNAAMRHYLSLNNRLAALPSWTDWHAPQQMMENLFASLYSDEVKCNVIVTSHLVQIDETITVPDPKNPGQTVKQVRPGSERQYPATLGKALSPKVGRYFNSCLLARSVPFGSGVKRKIFTDSQGIIELKNTAPLSLKKEYPIETGLAEYFAAVRRPLSGGADPGKPQQEVKTAIGPTSPSSPG